MWRLLLLQHTTLNRNVQRTPLFVHVVSRQLSILCSELVYYIFVAIALCIEGQNVPVIDDWTIRLTVYRYSDYYLLRIHMMRATEDKKSLVSIDWSINHRSPSMNENTIKQRKNRSKMQMEIADAATFELRRVCMCRVQCSGQSFLWPNFMQRAESSRSMGGENLL